MADYPTRDGEGNIIIDEPGAPTGVQGYPTLDGGGNTVIPAPGYMEPGTGYPTYDGEGNIIIEGGAAPTSPPVNTVAPVLSGSFFVGQTLTCSTGTWTGGGITYTYQWRNAGVDIGGATNNTYVLVSGDDGDLIDCVVTATNSAGSDSEPSNAVYARQARVWLDETSVSHTLGLASLWSDKSGNGSNFSQGSASLQPDYGVVTINGLNTVSSDASRGVSMDGGGSSLRDFLAAWSYDVYIVYKRTVDQAGRILQVSNGASPAVVFTLNADGNVAMSVGGTATTTGGSDDLNAHLYTAYATNAENRVKRDGATDGVQTTVSVPATVTQQSRIFRDFNDLNRLAAGIGEIIITTTSSSAIRTQIENYLTDKWGI